MLLPKAALFEERSHKSRAFRQPTGVRRINVVLLCGAIFGRADGTEFNAGDFLTQHPQYSLQRGYLKDRPAQSWTFFEG